MANEKGNKTSIKISRGVKILLIIDAVLAVLAAFSGICYFAARGHEAFIRKVYAEGIFPVLTWPLKKLASLFPFSVGEVILFMLIIGVALGLFAGVAQLIIYKVKHIGGGGSFLKRYALCVLAVLLMIPSCFVWLGGMNYNSLQFKDMGIYNVHKADLYELIDLCKYISDKVAETREGLPKNDKGVVIAPDGASVSDILAKAGDGYKELAKKYPLFDEYTVNPKPAMLSELMMYEGIAGIFPILYTESLVNKIAPIYTIPLTASHELAHQYGFAQEDEANFVGFLACINSDDPLYIYSGYYTAYIYCMNELYSYDKDAWYEIAIVAKECGIYNDTGASKELWESYQKKSEITEIIANVSDKVNDSYLESNNVYDGVYSYNRIVDLLIAYYEQEIK